MDQLTAKMLQIMLELSNGPGQDNQLPDEAQFLSLFKSIADNIFEGAELDDEPDGYDRVYSWMSARVAAGLKELEQGEVRFFEGALYGAIGVHEASVRKSKEHVLDGKRNQVLAKRHDIFKAVQSHRGITHGELADACDLSASALTQAISKFDGLGLLVSSRNGREKHYYLSNTAERLLSSPSRIGNSETSPNECQLDRNSLEVSISYVLPPDSASTNAFEGWISDQCRRPYEPMLNSEDGLVLV